MHLAAYSVCQYHCSGRAGEQATQCTLNLAPWHAWGLMCVKMECSERRKVVCSIHHIHCDLPSWVRCRTKWENNNISVVKHVSIHTKRKKMRAIQDLTSVRYSIAAQGIWGCLNMATQRVTVALFSKAALDFEMVVIIYPLLFCQAALNFVHLTYWPCQSAFPQSPCLWGLLLAWVRSAAS